MAQKNWPGTQQSDTYQNTSDMKPVQPPREGMQFAQETDYFDVRFNNKWNNPLVTDNQFNHESATAGEGQFGDRQFASNRRPAIDRIRRQHGPERDSLWNGGGL